MKRHPNGLAVERIVKIGASKRAWKRFIRMTERYPGAYRLVHGENEAMFLTKHEYKRYDKQREQEVFNWIKEQQERQVREEQERLRADLVKYEEQGNPEEDYNPESL